MSGVYVIGAALLCVGAVVVFGVVGLFLIFRRERGHAPWSKPAQPPARQDAPRPMPHPATPAWFPPAGQQPAAPAPVQQPRPEPAAHPEPAARPEPVTAAPGQPMAALIVLQSEDPALVQRALPVQRVPLTLGRGAQNDIVFSADTSVSRQHAVIDVQGGQFVISEAVGADRTGAPKRPTFGTFVNETRVKDAPLALHSGDVIHLGPFVQLQFHLTAAVDESRAARHT